MKLGIDMNMIKYWLLALTLLITTPFALANKNSHWIGTWAAAPQMPGPFDAEYLALDDQTIRQIVRISHGGDSFRIKVSNLYGTQALTVNAASIAVSVGGAAIDASTVQALTFGGDTATSIAPGAKMMSDPVDMQVADLTDLAVSLHIGEGSAVAGSPVTGHVWALQDNYVMTGDQTAVADPLYDAITTTNLYLTGVEVAVNKPTPVIAMLGDSITDGVGSTLNANQRLPNLIAERILGGGTPRARGLQRAAVLNLGISGNQATTTLIGENVQARLDRDVLAQSGVTHVVVLIGINDIGLPGFANLIGIPIPFVEADQLIAAHKQIIARSKAQGLKVIGATLTPSGLFALPDYNTPVGEAKRQAVNTWIREESGYDAVLDFDAIIRDPEDETIIRTDLSDDGLHPNDLGYQLLAESLVLSVLKLTKRNRRY